MRATGQRAGHQRSDAEAKRFVVACRNAMAPGPARSLTDADRARGLIHAVNAAVLAAFGIRTAISAPRSPAARRLS